MRGNLRLTAAALVAVLVLALATPAWAATAPLVQNIDTSAFPRVVFTLVLPPEAVPVKGDTPEVNITENGLAIQDVGVSSLEKERTAIDVVLLIDVSGSMRGTPLADAQAAARRFVDSMGPSDRIAVVAFSTEPVILQQFTSDRAALYAAVDGLVAGGETALYDGLVQAASVVGGSAATERYIVALSDGGDTLSINPAENAARAVADAKAPVYAVALESPEYNPATLEGIARASSGRMTAAADSAALADIFQSIAEEMQLRYRVVFQSTRPNTVDLELGVTVGSGDDAATTTLAVRNPTYTGSEARTGSPFQPVRTNAPALTITVIALFLSIGFLSYGVGLMLRRDKAALQQLSYYDNLQARSTTVETYQDTSVRGGLVEALSAVAERRGLTGKVQAMIDSAGMKLRASEFAMFVTLGVLVVIAVTLAATGGSLPVVFLGVVLALAAPFLFLRQKAASRLKKFDSQLPDILDLISGSLRSGWGVQQALDLVVDEVGDPAQTEFRRTQAESRLGMPFDEALQRMAQRVQSPDLQWAVNAISIQREVGGNLAEVLGIVSSTIRQRGQLARQVKALTAEGTFTMAVLASLPFLLILVLLLISPEYVMEAFTSPIGIGAYAFGAIMLVLGILWINSIVKIEV